MNQCAAAVVLAIVGLNFLGSWFVSSPEGGGGWPGGRTQPAALGSLRKDCFRNP